MLDRVNSVNKSYSTHQQLQYSRRCPGCKQPFEQEHYRQQFCRNIKCRKRRHVEQQTEVQTEEEGGGGISRVTAIVEWTRDFLVDRFKYELATFVEKQNDLTDLNDSNDQSNIRKLESNKLNDRKYYNQAHTLLKIGALKPTPSFMIYLSDLSPQLVKELHGLDNSDRQFVMKQAVGRIFEDINQELYHSSISRVLKVKLQ